LLTKELGIPAGQVHFELFHTGDLKPEVKSQEEVTDFKGTAEVTVRIDGKETTFHLAYDKESILDAGIRQGLDLPYSCKGGVCCTCRAQLLEGKVHMDQNYALEDDEVEEGFILTCQSHPRAGKLFVDYDV
ncbi:MAG TPA: 2Fe-2S iron-sulfur cluster-binding protein, partial [Saprospiraceae bacterium]|nr:2Fe-2S iron-sulfur cluster-binding protein [Saprospiraceae bacterium]